jgi:SAM-dependent methyltransferase
MTIAEVLPLLRCVECDAPVASDANELACTKCQARWRSVNGIFDLRPSTSLPMPAMYEDRHYRQWNDRHMEGHDYLYRSNPLLAWVQNAGHRHIRAVSKSSPEALTLDMGCGDGAHRPFMWRPDRAVGVDVDQRALEEYRARCPEAAIVRGDCYRLPFGNGVFDRVVNIYNLEHLIHLDFALEEARRVLKDEGELLVSVPTEGGAAWTMGRRMTTARQFARDGFDYTRSNAIDHCNCVWQVEKTIRRHFRVASRHLFPLVVPSYHLNLIVSWSLRK